MRTFYELYNEIVNAGVQHNLDELKSSDKLIEFDPHHLDCLLNPYDKAPVIRLEQCSCPDGERDNCIKSCLFDAISRDEDGNMVISPTKCTGCGACIDECKVKLLTERRDLAPLFELLSEKNDEPVYAMIAPAFTGQFDKDVTPGKLRSAFKALGFAGMIEVALFADILTLKEALEFDRSIHNDSDYMLTSCCCPIWIAMIRKIYDKLIPHVPPSVSPMVACGRSIKKLYPNAKTVFIGPCVAKKAEAKEADIKDSVDIVLTFNEVQDLFDAANINPAKLDEDLRDHSSTAGIIYARTGGVSEAVQNTLNRLTPDRAIPLRAKQADGALKCKALLNEIISGNVSANFIEGMGCVGGCVGGPKALISKEEGTLHVNEYGSMATYETPADNPYVMELLHRLGFDTVKSLLEDDGMFTRYFTSMNK